LIAEMNPFQTHCIEAARTFVQTAIVIDNEATLGISEQPETIAPKVAVRVSASILTGNVLAARGEEAALGNVADQTNTPRPESVAAQPALEAVVASPVAPLDETTETSATDFNAKALTDAFSKLSVICGIYKPEKGATLVEAFTDAAQHADIVIVDWFLETGSSLAAKDIVLRVLTNDAEESGRLRLIAIYTSQPDLPRLAQELLDEIRRSSPLVENLTLEANSRVLTGRSTRICFFNKIDSPGVPQEYIVAVEDLPGQLLEEFAMLTEGVLSTYAVTSIAAVRRAIHSLIAIFSKELDGVYVAHRCSLPHPEDASDFARELVISEISNLISMDQASDKCTSAPVIESWIDHIAESGRRFSTADAEASTELMKEFVSGGASVVADSFTRQTVPNNAGANPSKKKALGIDNLAEAFYDSPTEAFERNAEFSRLSTFKREILRGNRSKGTWVPTLSLGTVLRVVSAYPQTKEMDDEFPFQYLVCVQPRCDSVRLKSPTSFPFQIATFDETTFNLVVNEESVGQRTLRVTYKPRDVVMRKFIPDPSSEMIRATKDPSGQFIFEDKTGISFAWVGDIKDLKAQRDASELAVSVHRVGLEDFEWLRLKGQA
jgi:hypothetical protein